MTNLSPEVAESVKSLQEAAEMVNEPFKKIDTTALDSMISTSLEKSAENHVSPSENLSGSKLGSDSLGEKASESSVVNTEPVKDDNK